MAGMWVSPTEYVEFSDSPERERLMEEIATRQAAWDWTGFIGLLPDPDPVLRKMGDCGVEVLESLTADGHLLSAIQQRQLGTLKKEFRFEPGVLPGEKKASRRAVQLRDSFAGDLEDNVDLYNLVAALLNAPLYGNIPVELKWRPSPDNNRMAVKDLEAKPSWWFGYDIDNQPRFISMTNPWDGLELPFGKFAFCRHFPSYANPFGLRLLSRCLFPVAFKKGGIKFWAIRAEKYGIPFLVGKHRPGAPLAEKQEMLSNLTRMVRDAVAVIAQGGAVEIIESGKGGGNDDINRSLVHEMNAEMSKTIMLQTLTAEVSDTGGSRAQGQVHQDMLELAQSADQALVKKTMEEIAWIYTKVNAPDVPAPKFIWFEEDDPKKEFAERDKSLVEGGVEFKKSHYVKTYGFDEVDFDLKSEKQPIEPGTKVPGKTTADAPEFAELQQQVFTDQAALDAGIAAFPPDLLRMCMQGPLMPVIEMIQGGSSIEAVQEKLLELYPQMNTDLLEETLARAIFVADVWGMMNASVEGEE